MPDLYVIETRYASGVPPFRYQGFLAATPLQAESFMRDAGWLPYTESSYYGGFSRHIVPATWRERETALIEQGVYVAPIWSRETFWLNADETLRDHFAHVSLEDPTMVAFTASPEHGEADRQTRMKPGKYLKRYYSDVLSDRKIAALAEWFATGTKPIAAVEGDLGFAKTGDEIVETYGATIGSCMRAMDCVRVYAAGDLAVAYWRDDDGDVRARVLCWPDKKAYGRVYPERPASSYADALIRSLEAQGYRDEVLVDGGFNGARIKQVSGCDGWIMPYLDRGYGVNDADGHWVMSNRPEYQCDSTSGYIGEPDDDRAICEHCDERCDDTFAVRAGSAWVIYWCEHCEAGDAFYCEATQQTYSVYHHDRATVDGAIWTMTALNDALEAGTARYDDDADTYTTAPLPVAETETETPSEMEAA